MTLFRYGKFLIFFKHELNPISLKTKKNDYKYKIIFLLIKV